jgi:hypothetical protein
MRRARQRKRRYLLYIEVRMNKSFFYRNAKKWSPFLFFIIIAFINLTLIYITYQGYKKHVILITRERLQNLAFTGAGLLDIDAYKKLVLQLSPDMDFAKLDPNRDLLGGDAFFEKMEKTPEYKKISDQLNIIRNSQPDLILYVYTLVPTSDGKVARFVVDADVLQPEKSTVDNDTISHFSLKYSIADQPVTMEALRSHLSIVDTEFRNDPEYNSVSLMGFSPIYDSSKNFLGVIGMDISDVNMQKALADVEDFFVFSAGIALLLSFGASIAAGYIIRGMLLRIDFLEMELVRKSERINVSNLEKMENRGK